MTEAERHTIRRRGPGVHDAAVELDISDKQVRRLIASGDLEAIDVSVTGSKRKEYRIPPEKIADFKRRRSTRVA